MNTSPLDPVFAAALRQHLVDDVSTGPRPSRSRMQYWRPGRWFVVGSLLTVGATGGGIAVATDLVPMPGTDRVTITAPANTTVHRGSATIDFGDRPQDSTNVELTLTCLTPGTFTFAHGTSLTCTPDENFVPGTSTETLVLTTGQNSTTITTNPDARWSVTTAYSHHERQPFAVNAHGDTYGADTDRGTPDLVSVYATNGRIGYAYSRDLAPPEERTFSSPVQARSWQRDHAQRTRTIPVYESDGQTVIGQFQIGPAATSPGRP